MESKSEKREYAAPRVDTLTVQELIEAVGPAQGLASGVESSALDGKRILRTGGGRRGRGGRG